jgi:hypothetical protein
MVCFTLLPLYPLEKSSEHPSGRRLDLPHSLVGVATAKIVPLAACAPQSRYNRHVKLRKAFLLLSETAKLSLSS